MPAKTSDKPSSAADLKDRIRKVGLRSTGSRIAVLRVMEECTAPMTHQEVAAKLEGMGFDHVTIYRNLTDLTEAGVLSRTDLGDRVWRFGMRRGDIDHKQEHPHFICVDCGDIACLPDQAVSLNKAPGTPRALRRKGVVIQIQGRCDRCERGTTAAG